MNTLRALLADHAADLSMTMEDATIRSVLASVDRAIEWRVGPRAPQPSLSSNWQRHIGG
jgi:hypothetical protein